MNRIYKNLKLRVYQGYSEFQKEEGLECVFTDKHGNIVEVSAEDIDLSISGSKEHFALF